VPAYGVYLGADPNQVSGVDTLTQAQQLEREIGRPLGIVSFFTGFGKMPSLRDLRAVSAAGSIPMVSMHCGGLNSAVAAGRYDAQLRTLALAYRAFRRPVLLRWFWEYNLTNIIAHRACLGTNAALWSAYYVAAFRHIWTVFHNAGATNVSFVWCPSDAHFSKYNENVDLFFPGVAYVGWIGADLYDKPSRYAEPFQTAYRPFYSYWSNPAHGGGRPLIVCETGSIGVHQSAWLNEIRLSLEYSFPAVHALVYGDADALFDYRLQTGTAGMRVFTQMANNAYFMPFAAGDGFVIAARGGRVAAFFAHNFGGTSGSLRAPVVGIANDRAAPGYWLVGSDGSVYPFGQARYFGSMRGVPLAKPIVGMAATADGRGYWLVASDGGVFSFGDARFHGSMGGKHLNKPIVGMTSSPDGRGYWFVASDGGIFTFGDARFRGSTGSLRLHKPIDGMTATPDGNGYWLVASDGGIFTFGDAHFLGSLGATRIVGIVAGMAVDPSGGYRMVTSAGTIYQFPGNVIYHAGRFAAVGIATA
jgi:hypothetical protein